MLTTHSCAPVRQELPLARLPYAARVVGALAASIMIIADDSSAAARAPRPRQDPAAFVELKGLLAGQVILYDKVGLRIEYCPDNTCDVFSGDVEVREDVASFAHAYILWVSDNEALAGLRRSTTGKEAAQSALRRARAAGCGMSDPATAIKCFLRRLAARSDIKVSWVTYDENERNEEPVDLERELARLKEARNP